MESKTRGQLRRKNKEREELSPEGINVLANGKKTIPFDERRNRFRKPDRTPSFTEVDSSDPDFEFERFPVRSDGKN